MYLSYCFILHEYCRLQLEKFDVYKKKNLVSNMPRLASPLFGWTIFKLLYASSTPNLSTNHNLVECVH